MMALRLVENEGGVRFAVKVVPGASRDRIVGELGDALKIAVSKPARDGAANAAAVALLAAALGVPQSSIRLVRGHAQPRKEIFVTGLSAQQAAAQLNIHEAASPGATRARRRFPANDRRS